MTHPAKTIGIVGTVLFSSFCLNFSNSAFAKSPTDELRLSLKDSPKAIVDEAWQVVNRSYVDDSFNQVDWVKSRTRLLSKNYSTPQQAYAAIRRELERLEDPYTRFMDPQQFQTLTDQTSGELTGVGVIILNDARTGSPFIVKVIQDSPAEKAGVKPGDIILNVDDKSTVDLSAQDVAKLMRGEVDSFVRVKLLRQGIEPFSLSIPRGIIELQAVNYQLKEESNTRIGYIQISEFSRHTTEQVQEAINALTTSNVDAFVLDLRGNPGGLLDSSIEIAQMWLNQGLIVRTVDRTGKPEQYYARRAALTNLPLAVLVNQASASSSEILTGALQDNKRATVIGTKTFGKALVQSVHQLADGSGIAVTVAHYYTPNGTDISRTGITPDVLVSMSQSQALQLNGNRSLITTIFDHPYQWAVRTLRKQVNKGVQSNLFLQTPPSVVPKVEPTEMGGVQS
jgi:carboxyl-terminal processing protease